MDNYIVSARKYRPSTFHSVVGQKSLTTTLKNAIINNKLAHAYLFCGPRGVGKTTCARIFAKTINCFHPTADGEACNACESCVSFNENRSLNIYELDAASNNSVDDIRALTEQVRILPQLGEYKVYIIDEVHMLSSAAFNAFLKTLEEPPHHAIFILATTEKHKILPTILSRCQIYDFNRIGIHDIVEYLEYVATQEKVQYEKEALGVIAQKADGGMRDALSIFDQMVSFSQGNLTYKSVIANLNVLDYEYYFQLMDAVLAGNVSQCLLLLNEILNKGFDGHQVITGLAVFLRDLLVCKDPQTIVLFEVGEAVREKYVQLAARCETPFLYKAIDYTNETDLSYRYSKNKRLSIELLLIRLCQINASDDSEDAKKKKVVIKPIVASQPEKKPVAVATPQPVQATPPATPPQTQTPPEPKAGGPLRISLNKPKTEDTATKAEAQTQAVLDTPFTQTDLEEAWKAFVQTITDAHFQSIAQYAKIQLENNTELLIKVLNPEQESLFVKEATHIVTYLSGKLNNNQIKLTVQIEEAETRESLFTSKEKYTYLADKNPSLQLLVKEFNLRLD